MGGAPTPKWDPIGFDNRSRMEEKPSTDALPGLAEGLFPQPLRHEALLLADLGLTSRRIFRRAERAGF